jgi:hypothetical protein
MEKTSKVTRVTGNGTWDSKYGTMFKFEVEFANGDIGEYNSKSKDQTKFVVDKEAAYEITSKENNGNTYYTVKPLQAQASFNGGGGKYDAETSKKIARMSVLKCSTDLVIAGHVKFDALFEYAKFMEAYVETGIDSFNTMYAQAEEQKMQGKRDELPNLPF